MASSLQEYISALNEPTGQQARIEFCRRASECLRATGNALWAYGLSGSPARRSLAIVIQMAASLSSGASALLALENWYASAALLRQVVEVEYLLWLFSVEPAQAESWLAASQDDLRRLYSPGRMRKKSAGRFRDTEYWSHCELGGHPNPKASSLLDEHLLPSDASPLGPPSWLWVDLGQHLERLWHFADSALRANDLAHVGVVSTCLHDMPVHITHWHAQDRCAPLIDDATGWKVE